MNKKPNILFLFPDQQRGDSLGCVGHPVVKTPVLDGLAEEGVTFTGCYTNSPLCVPARASLQTGQYVSRHGAWNNGLAVDPKGPSFVRNIRDAGYRTAVIGKTHLWLHGIGQDTGAHTKDNIDNIREWGFEDSIELTGPMASTGHNSPYTDALEEKGLLDAYRKYQFEYVLRNYVLKLTKDIPARFRSVMDRYSISLDTDTDNLWLEPAWPLPTDDHYDSYTGLKAAEWIEAYDQEKPFFLMVGFPGPHDPFDSPEEYRAMYRPEEIPIGILEGPEEPVPEHLKRLLRLSGLDRMTPAHMQEMMAAYYGKVTLIDDYIGKIMDSLEAKGLLDNTWIIYSSDHGELLGDHRLCHKMTFYEGALRIPCIIRPAGGVSGWQTPGLTDQLDLAATMLDIAGAEPFKDSDGQSLKQKIEAGSVGPEARKGKDRIFSELGGLIAMFDGRFKMTVEIKTREPVQLYVLEKDPMELQNRVGQAFGPVGGEAQAPASCQFPA